MTRASAPLPWSAEGDDMHLRWHGSGRGFMRQHVVGAMAAVLAVVALAACTSPPAPSVLDAAPSVRSADGSFITISGGTVEERDARTGRPVATLARDASSAAETADGTMFSASAGTCSGGGSITEVGRTDGISRVMNVSTEARALSASRDGAWIGYLTYSRCPSTSCPVGSCRGAAIFGPNVVDIEDVATGRTSRITTTPGSGIDGVTFSPDGRRFAMLLHDEVVIMPTADPHLSGAVRLSPPKGCGYGQPAWTMRGIDVGEGCGADDGPASPTRLVLLDPDTPQAADALTTIPLPRCIDGFTLAVDPTDETVLTTASIGYGDGSCASTPGKALVHIAALRNGHLTDLLAVPPGAKGIQAVA